MKHIKKAQTGYKSKKPGYDRHDLNAMSKGKPTTAMKSVRPGSTFFSELDSTKKSKMQDGGMLMEAKGGKWIQKAIKKPGALRAQLGAKPGKPIPAGKLAKAAKAKGKLGQRARLAQTLKKMKKK